VVFGQDGEVGALGGGGADEGFGFLVVGFDLEWLRGISLALVGRCV